MIYTYILTIRLLRERAKFCSETPYPIHLKFTNPSPKHQNNNNGTRNNPNIACNTSPTLEPKPARKEKRKLKLISFRNSNSTTKSTTPATTTSNKVSFGEDDEAESSSPSSSNGLSRSDSSEQNHDLTARASQGIKGNHVENNGQEQQQNQEEEVKKKRRRKSYLSVNHQPASASPSVSRKNRRSRSNSYTSTTSPTQTTPKKRKEKASPPKSQHTEPLAIRAHSSYQVKSEQKATHVLGLVFFAFIICWTPFFTLNILIGFKRDLGDSVEMIATVFLWLGYMSSTLNPIIYTIFNRNFRTAFRRIIMCNFRSFNTRAHPHPTRVSTSSSHRISTTQGHTGGHVYHVRHSQGSLSHHHHHHSLLSTPSRLSSQNSKSASAIQSRTGGPEMKAMNSLPEVRHEEEE